MYAEHLVASSWSCRSISVLTYIAISGAVYSDSVPVDKLTTLSLLFQPNDYLAMTQLARTFKLALHGMKHYCTNLTTGLSNEEIKQLRFPHFKTFKNGDAEDMITYKEKIKSNVFHAVTKLIMGSV